MTRLPPPCQTASNLRKRAGFASIASLLALLLTLPFTGDAQINYTTNSDGTLNVVGFTGPGGAVIIPATNNGLAVGGIGAGAFRAQTQITSISIPDTVTNIGFEAFVFCGGLGTITVDPQNPYYSSLDGVLFDKGQTAVLICPAGRYGNYTVPGGVVTIAKSAFYSCHLTNVILPGSVTSIRENSFTFSGLANIAIPNAVTNIGDGAFMNCSGLTRVTLPANITSIGSYTFEECVSLTNITIPGSVTSIGFNAFGFCGNMTAATIGSSVSHIESYAFANCVNLKAVYFEGSPPGAGSGAFYQDDYVTMHFLPWKIPGPWYGVLPTTEWLPNISNFGLQSNQFGFTVTWARDQTVVIQANSDLSNTNWVPVGTNTITDGSFHFNDPGWTNFPARYYRVGVP